MSLGIFLRLRRWIFYRPSASVRTALQTSGLHRCDLAHTPSLVRFSGGRTRLFGTDNRRLAGSLTLRDHCALCACAGFGASRSGGPRIRADCGGTQWPTRFGNRAVSRHGKFGLTGGIIIGHSLLPGNAGSGRACTQASRNRKPSPAQTYDAGSLAFVGKGGPTLVRR